MEIVCAYCGQFAEKRTGDVNRAKTRGAPIYCGKVCSGLAKRLDPDAKREAAARRQREYWQRPENAARKKARAAELFQQSKQPGGWYPQHRERMRTDPEYRAKHKACQARCQARPDWKARKQEYDREWRATRHYGNMAEAFLVLMELESEVEKRIEWLDLQSEKGTANKCQTRRRAYHASEETEC